MFILPPTHTQSFYFIVKFNLWPWFQYLWLCLPLQKKLISLLLSYAWACKISILPKKSSFGTVGVLGCKYMVTLQVHIKRDFFSLYSTPRPICTYTCTLSFSRIIYIRHDILITIQAYWISIIYLPYQWYYIHCQVKVNLSHSERAES